MSLDLSIHKNNKLQPRHVSLRTDRAAAAANRDSQESVRSEQKMKNTFPFKDETQIEKQKA